MYCQRCSDDEIQFVIFLPTFQSVAIDPVLTLRIPLADRRQRSTAGGATWDTPTRRLRAAREDMVQEGVSGRALLEDHRYKFLLKRGK